MQDNKQCNYLTEPTKLTHPPGCATLLACWWQQHQVEPHVPQSLSSSLWTHCVQSLHSNSCTSFGDKQKLRWTEASINRQVKRARYTKSGRKGGGMELPVVHHQNLKLFDVVNKKFLETIGKIVTRLLVRAIANIGHQSTSLELSSYSRINTLWSTPAWLNKNI